jgi:3-methyladenine DNA glycosylase AlkD
MNNDTTLNTAAEIQEAMSALANEAQRAILMGFFKTAPGQYGAGDQFLGLKVPQTHSIVRRAEQLPPREIERLLQSPWHEMRLCGLLIVVRRMEHALHPTKGSTIAAEEWAHFYLEHLDSVNNWDLVDLSAPYILGAWLAQPMADGSTRDRSILDRLAVSGSLWRQRVAIVATLGLIRRGETLDTLRLAERLLTHPHDLIHKAVGWMLREVGKKEIGALRGFLQAHAHEMPRTALRYSIERMTPEERKEWMQR